MKANIGRVDEIIRYFIAIFIVILYWLNTINGIMAIVLLAVAIIFVLTSIIRVCPLYILFDFSTCRTENKSKK